MASRMHYTPEQLVEGLAKSGVHANTLKARIRADIAWQQLVRGRFQAALQVGEKDIADATAIQSRRSRVGYRFHACARSSFSSPRDRSPRSIDGRRREAEALRGRFSNCDEGIPFARALKDVAVREQVNRSSAGLPPELRKVLDGMGSAS